MNANDLLVSQELLFDSEAAKDAKKDALQRVDENAEEDWKERAHIAVREIAELRPRFTTDAVWALLGETPHEPRAMGAIMQAAARAGICAPTPEYHNSARVACHARPLRIWRSLIYRGNGDE